MSNRNTAEKFIAWSKSGSLAALRPASELSADQPHGTRLKYLGGCKCLKCRAANSAYKSKREKAIKRGNWNGFVPAEKARKHLAYLSGLGIGYKTVADIAGMSKTCVWKIKSGQSAHLRAQNERRILAVDKSALPESALVSAAATWQKIRWMLKEGFTEKTLALKLGYKTGILQLNKKKITARNALKVEKLYRSLRLGE